jgi:cell division septal protein FtsQ
MVAEQEMAGKAKTRARDTGHNAEADDVQPRQPVWRQAPAKPRKKVKQRTFATQRSGGEAYRGRGPARTFVAPSRDTVFGWLRIAALAVVVAGVAVGLVYLLRWPLLTVEPGSTFIGGAQRIDPSEIYDKSEIAGRSISVLRAADVESRLMQVPGVAEADVHLRLPNQVIIDVVEHSPLVAWQAVTNTVWLAADGSIVPQSGARPPLQLVDQSGGRLMTDPALKSLILDNLKTLREASPDISELYYGNSQGLYYRTTDGWDVWLGESGGMREKVALASAAGRDIARSGAHPKVIDVRHSDRKAMWW